MFRRMYKRKVKYCAVIWLGLVIGLSMTAFSATPLRVTITATPEGLDPAVYAYENDLKVAVNVYDFLLFPSREEGVPEPWVAESWEVSEDEKTYTFRIRKGIKFHDGSDLTAEDIKFNIERLLAIGQGFAFLLQDRIEDIVVTNPYTVVFELAAPYGPFLQSMCFIPIVSKDLVMANLKEGSYGEYGDYGTGFLLTHDGGSGPYKVEEFVIREKIVFTKNLDYWRGISEESPDRAEWIQLREATTTKMMMRAGELDLVHGRQELTTLDVLSSIPNVVVASIPELSIDMFQIHTQKPPTDDVHIRRAMAWATDYDAMLDIYPGCKRVCGPVPETAAGFTEETTCYVRNLEKAESELRQSKYYGQLDQYPITVSWIQGNGDTGKLCMLFASNMAEIGLKVKLAETPWVLFCNQAEAMDTSPHVTNLFNTSSVPDAALVLESKYATRTVSSVSQNEWLMDEEFDTAIAEALAESDPAQRYARYAELQQYIVNDVCPSIFVFQNVLKAAYRTDRFSWPAGEGDFHVLAEFNYRMSDFVMLEENEN